MHTLSVYRRADLAYIPPRVTALHIHLGNTEAVGADDIALLPAGLKVLRVHSITHDAIDVLAKRLGALTQLELHVNRLGPHALDALDALPDLTHFALHSAREDLPSLAKLTRLNSLSLSCKSGAAIARQLDNLTALTTLTLGGAQRLTSADLAVVAKLPKLARLDLSGIASREPDALVALKGCDALRTLCVHNMHALSSREVEVLGALPHLTTAALTAHTQDDLAALAPLDAKLHTLHLRPGIPSAQHVDDDFLRALVAHLPRTRSLNLVGAQHRPRNVQDYTAAGLAKLAKLDRLVWLCTGRLPKHIKPDDLTWLAQLPALQHLHLWGASMGPKILDTLKSCAALTTLALDDIKVSDAAVKKLTALTKLEALKLHHAPLTDKGFIELGKIKSLTSLYLLVDEGQLGDAGLKALGTLPALRELYLDLWYSTYSGTSLAPLAAIPTLERLRLDPHVSDLCRRPDGLRSLAGAPALWHLEVGQYSQGKLDDATEAAMRTIPNLLHLGGVLPPGALAGQALVTNQFGWYPETTPSEYELAWA
jgi:hypothetical protein